MSRGNMSVIHARHQWAVEQTSKQHLNGYTLGFHLETQKLEPLCAA